MNPVSPVMPGSESIEVVLGKDQPQYMPLPAVYVDGHTVVTRWELTNEEYLAIANGADIILTQLTFGHPFQPVNLQVKQRNEFPDEIHPVATCTP